MASTKDRPFDSKSKSTRKKCIHIDIPKSELKKNYISENNAKKKYSQLEENDLTKYRNGKSRTVYYLISEIESYENSTNAEEENTQKEEESLVERVSNMTFDAPGETLELETPDVKIELEEKNKDIDNLFQELSQKKKEAVSEKTCLTMYVDGSFNKATGVYGSAVVITEGDKVINTFKCHGTEMAAMWNVAGEIEAAMQAVKIAKELLADELLICYDYEGIEKWATGAWQAKKEETQMYQRFMQKAQQEMVIRFKHTPAHSGIEFNELADRLAEEAAGNVPLESRIPLYNNKDKHEPTHILAEDFDVPLECLSAIKMLTEKPAKRYSDYVRLKTGRCDAFSGMRGDDFETVLDPSAFAYLKENTNPGSTRNEAMRWAARGLNADEALKKALIDREVYGNSARVSIPKEDREEIDGQMSLFP